MNTWLSGIIGQGIAANIGAAGCYSSAQQASQYGAMAAQQAYNVGMTGMSQGQLNAQSWTPPRWMFNGKMMTFQEFVDAVFPEDTPEKTAFVLKYSE